MAKKLLAVLSSWAPSKIIGGLPGRATSWVWYDMQVDLELSHLHSSSLYGFALDIQKCYNGIPRRPMIILMIKMGFPQNLAESWLRFLQGVRRTVSICDSFSEPCLSYTGIPEGDPLSVPAMVCLCILWDFWIQMQTHETKVNCWAYLDNLEISTENFEALDVSIRQSWYFLEAFSLLPDIHKSWSWSTKNLTAKQTKALQATSDHLGHLRHVSSATDLGASLRYKGGVTLTSIRQKFVDTADRITRLFGLPLTVTQQWNAVSSGCASKVLYALELIPIGFTHFKKLRTKIANLITQTDNRNVFLVTSMTCYPIKDPEVQLIKSCFRMFRDYIYRHQHCISLLATCFGELSNKTNQIKGPLGTLSRWIQNDSETRLVFHRIWKRSDTRRNCVFSCNGLPILFMQGY